MSWQSTRPHNNGMFLFHKKGSMDFPRHGEAVELSLKVAETGNEYIGRHNQKCPRMPASYFGREAWEDFLCRGLFNLSFLSPDTVDAYQCLLCTNSYNLNHVMVLALYE